MLYSCKMVYNKVGILLAKIEANLLVFTACAN